MRVIFDVPAKDAHHAQGNLRATLEEVNARLAEDRYFLRLRSQRLTD